MTDQERIAELERRVAEHDQAIKHVRGLAGVMARWIGGTTDDREMLKFIYGRLLTAMEQLESEPARLQ